MGVDPHRVAEARSLELHRAVAVALASDPGLVDEARARVSQWRAAGRLAAAYADAWLAILDEPLGEIQRAITEDSESARALRQATPFAGVIDPRSRWRIWERVRTQLEDDAARRSRSG